MENNDQKEKIFEELYKYIGIIHVENIAKDADDIIEESKHLDFPEELDFWFTEYIGDTIKKSRVSLITKRAAMFLIILALGSFITTISVEAYRVRLFNIIANITEKYTDINIERNPNEQPIENDLLERSYFYPRYIPLGYKQSDIQNYDKLLLIHFVNENGDIIELLQSELDPDFQVDTEGATTLEIYINGSKGILVSKEDVKILFWFTDNNNFYIKGKLDQKEIVTMAESLEFKK